MTMLKSAKNGHNGCYAIWRYLLKDGRALKEATLNINDDGSSAGWYEAMDRTRRVNRNDSDREGRRAISYRHYIISPDPRDEATADQVLELGLRWAGEVFPRAQVAVVVHDDNDGRIPHAHVVVNNTDLLTGRRLRVDNAMARGTMPEAVNRISHEMGLTAMPVARRGEGAHAREARQERRRRERASLAERGLGSRSQTGWKAEIRAAVARAASRGGMTFEEFRVELQGSGYDVWKNGRGGYTFQHRNEIPGRSDHRHWRCKDVKLGFEFTPAGMARYYGVGAEQPEAAEFFDRMDKRERHVEFARAEARDRILSGLGVTLEDRAFALRYLVDNGISGMRGLDDVRFELSAIAREIDGRVSAVEGAIADSADGVGPIEPFGPLPKELESLKIKRSEIDVATARVEKVMGICEAVVAADERAAREAAAPRYAYRRKGPRRPGEGHRAFRESQPAAEGARTDESTLRAAETMRAARRHPTEERGSRDARERS